MRTFFVFSLLLFASVVCAQDPMAKWIPKVGDRFVYDFVYDNSGYSFGPYSDQGRETLYEVIVNTDSTTTADGGHVVVFSDSVTGGKFSTTRGTLTFHPSKDQSSSHPFFVEVNSLVSLDFSHSPDSQVMVGANQMTAYYADSSVVVTGQNENGFDSVAALYAPQMHWFLYRFEHSYYPPGQFGWAKSFSTRTLISANRAGVKHLGSQSTPVVEVRGSVLDVQMSLPVPLTASLLDALGRSVRSWQFQASDGPRELTLNASDVPSGVYFLRLQGRAIDEVRKVLIQ